MSIMKLKRNMDTPESREYWAFMDKMLKRVENYPEWKKGGTPPDSSGAESKPHQNPGNDDSA